MTTKKHSRETYLFTALTVVLIVGAILELALREPKPPPASEPALVLCVEGKTRDHCLTVKARWRP